MTISDCCPQPIFRPKVGRQPGHGDPASSRRGRPASEASRRGGSRRASHGCYSRPNFTVETAKGVRRGYRGYRGSEQPKQGRSNITGRQSDGQVSGRDGVSDSAQPTTRLRFNHDTSGRKSEAYLPPCPVPAVVKVRMKAAILRPPPAGSWDLAPAVEKRRGERSKWVHE